jgi:hypothetical protein
MTDMAKIKIDNVKLRRANDNDRSMGEINHEKVFK